MSNKEKSYIIGLDLSTKCSGVALFEDLGEIGDLKFLKHVSPKIKPQPKEKIQELFEKARIFREEFLIPLKGTNITKVIIEEPLINSNNAMTVATLLRFNGMIAKDVYDILGIVPSFISSYDARKFAFPQLMQIRTHNKKGIPYPKKHLEKAEPVLFGAHPWDVDKKQVIFDLVDELEPQVEWLYNKNGVLNKENYDMSDAYTCCLGYMRKHGFWN